MKKFNDFAAEQQKKLQADLDQARIEANKIKQKIRSLVKELEASKKKHGDFFEWEKANKRRQEWIDGEPQRAADRATPEWQAWHKKFQEDLLKKVK